VFGYNYVALITLYISLIFVFNFLKLGIMFSVIIYSAMVVGGLVYRATSDDGFDNSGDFDPWTDDNYPY